MKVTWKGCVRIRVIYVASDQFGLQKKPTPMTMLCEEISTIQHCIQIACKLTHSRRPARALRCSCLPKE